MKHFKYAILASTLLISFSAHGGDFDFTPNTVILTNKTGENVTLNKHVTLKHRIFGFPRGSITLKPHQIISIENIIPVNPYKEPSHTLRLSTLDFSETPDFNIFRHKNIKFKTDEHYRFFIYKCPTNGLYFVKNIIMNQQLDKNNEDARFLDEINTQNSISSRRSSRSHGFCRSYK